LEVQVLFPLIFDLALNLKQFAIRKLNPLIYKI
jgi:hypothetical protein